jgi:urease accessory protein
MEAPLLLRMIEEPDAKWNEMFLASRDTAELRAETVQMGYSLNRLLPELGVVPCPYEEPSFPAAYAHAVRAWGIGARDALVAYLWAWLENQVMAAVKAVPLGQTDGQKMLLALGTRLQDAGDEEPGNFAPGLAVLSSRHETQYSRLFRS